MSEFNWPEEDKPEPGREPWIDSILLSPMVRGL